MSILMETRSMLDGDNTIPGVVMSDKLKNDMHEVFQVCRDLGMDFYPTLVHLLPYDEISEVASYGGFPVRYSHYRFGMEYEEMSQGYKHNQYKIFEMVVNCVAPQSRIPTNRGSIFAKNVKVGDLVYSKTGSRQVVKVVSQPKKATKQIAIKGHQTTLDCSPNHRWRCLDNSGFLCWKRADELKPQDVLVGADIYEYWQGNPAALPWSMEKVLSETNTKVQGRVKEVFPPKQMTVELAELLGVILGDGTVGTGESSRNAISVCIDRKQPDYVTHVVNLFRKVFGEDSEIAVQETRPSVFNVVFCSKAAIDFLDTIGVTKGCTYKTKRVPWSIWESSAEFRAAFVRGLFDTDGHCSTSLSMSFYSADFAKDVQLLLLETGVNSIHSRINNDHNDISVLKINGAKNKFLVRDRIGFSLAYKQDALELMTEVCIAGQSDRASSPVLRDVICKAYSDNRSQATESLSRRAKRRQKQISAMETLSVSSAEMEVMNMAASGSPVFQELYKNVFHHPILVVEGVSDGPEMETIDIALDHDEHDFVCNGVVSHNTNPCNLYCLNSNSHLDHVTVIAHATAHNDFFKNNIYFEPSRQSIEENGVNVNMVNVFATHRTRMLKYEAQWGKETVSRFIDRILAIDTLIDPADAWVQREMKEVNVIPQKQYFHPKRIKMPEGMEHMDDWINSSEYVQAEKEKARKKEIQSTLGIFSKPTRNIFKYIVDHAPISEWERDVASMLYDEEMYFTPQGQTQILNEGWASYMDSMVMARMGFAQNGDIIDYADHKSRVLYQQRGKINPYKLGYSLLLDIENRWNKGRFGDKFDKCDDVKLRKEWDLKTNLGYEKLFEVRKFYNDVSFVDEFFTQDFCDEHKWYKTKTLPNGDVVIDSRDHKVVKKQIIQSRINRGLPVIHLADPNHKDRDIMLLEHEYDGRDIYDSYATEVLKSLNYLWKNPVWLSTKVVIDGAKLTKIYKADEGKVDISVS